MTDIKMIGTVAVFLLISYLIGNISPAILIGRACGIDIKKEGSGNAGTTNVLRVLGKKAAVGTLVIDIGKGAAAVLIGRYAGQAIGGGAADALPMICAVAVFLGHIWPVCFGFRGGKGVATAFGALAALSPAMGFSLLGIVLLVVLLTKRVSAGSTCGALAAPFAAHIFAPQYFYGVCIMAVIVVFKHRSNIKRLLKGEEPKLSFKDKSSGRVEK